MMKAKNADNKLALVSSISNVQIETQDDAITAIPVAVIESLPSRGVTIGRLVGIENRRPVVHYLGCPTDNDLVAHTVVPLTPDKIGKPVLLAFENDNQERPVIIGLVVEPEGESAVTSSVNLEIDGERLLLTAEREIVLSCGEGSITLTRAGKIIIKGTYVLSRSSGYNKIKGAAVDIN